MLAAMTSTLPATVDGSLPDARNQLRDAVSALIDPQPQHTHTGKTTWLDSR
jgi:hypothetical protein